MKKLFTFLFFACLSNASLLAQQIFKSGGTSNSTFLFSQPTYCSKSQSIFPPANLTNAISGDITTLYYKYGSHTGAQTMYNFTIKMGQTSTSAFVGGNTFFTGLTTVLTSPALVIPQGVSGNWFSIPLASNFTYDATQTLIIELTFDSVAVVSWGTLGTSNNPVRKVISADVNALTGSGTSSTWQDMGFDLAPLSVSNLTSASTEFSFFPNPTTNELSIAVAKNKSAAAMQFQLINNLGEQVMQFSIATGETSNLRVADLPRGIYLLKANSGEKISTQKIVLN